MLVGNQQSMMAFSSAFRGLQPSLPIFCSLDFAVSQHMIGPLSRLTLVFLDLPQSRRQANFDFC